MNKLFVANWKMKPASLEDAAALAGMSNEEGIIIAPPAPFLLRVKQEAPRAQVAAQNVFSENPKEGGAYTGEVSAAMFASLGASHVIVGHSERRTYFGETDELISKKMSAVLDAGLTPILCVGERIEVREKGMESAKQFVEEEVVRDVAGIAGKSGLSIIIAYEPIWAIGTGQNDTPENAREMIQHIKEVVKTRHPEIGARVLYGGSVNAGNIESFVREEAIDGCLVGGASANKEELPAMIAIMKAW